MEFAISGSSVGSVKLPSIANGRKDQIASALLPPSGKSKSSRAVSTTEVSAVGRSARSNSNPSVILEARADLGALESLPVPEDDRLVSYQAGRSPATSASASGRSSSSAQPIGMSRAKVWTVEVENAFRYQLAGFRDREEYEAMCGVAELWEDCGMIKCLKAKKTGYFMYFRKSRECEDKHLNKIKLYQYAT